MKLSSGLVLTTSLQIVRMPSLIGLKTHFTSISPRGSCGSIKSLLLLFVNWRPWKRFKFTRISARGLKKHQISTEVEFSTLAHNLKLTFKQCIQYFLVMCCELWSRFGLKFFNWWLLKKIKRFKIFWVVSLTGTLNSVNSCFPMYSQIVRSIKVLRWACFYYFIRPTFKW